MKIKTTVIAVMLMSMGANAQKVISLEGGNDSNFVNKYGNIGIGTNAPRDLLNLHNSDQTSNIGLKITRGNENHGLRLGVNNTHAFLWTTEIQNLVLATSDKERLTITSDGNVGIGTTSPSVKLDINGDAKFGGHILLDKQLRFNQGSTNYQIYNVTDNLWIRDITNSKDLIRIGSNSTNFKENVTFGGNVGIGTTSPSAKLDVNGVIKGSVFSTGGTSYGSEGIFGGSNPIEIFSGDELIFNSSNQIELSSPYINLSSAIFIKNNNVGIGTSDTKGYKLGVNGKIVATEVKVALYNNWSDFVFYEDYKLPTLKEVEKYIIEKGHLKDIPSAKEVKKNGFFLGEMDAKLLQKIEELTLYTIGQEKKIKYLENQLKEIEELKKQNSRIKDLEILVQKLLKDKN